MITKAKYMYQITKVIYMNQYIYINIYISMYMYQCIYINVFESIYMYMYELMKGLDGPI